MSKKLACMGMIAILSLGLFTACGKSNRENTTESIVETETDETKTNETETNETETTKLEPETIANSEPESQVDTAQSEVQPVANNYVDTGDAELNGQCDNILNSILNENMSERDRLYAIYTWVENNIRYSGNTQENGWVSGAKTSIAKGKGNCYAFYSVSAALLTRAGYENVQVNELDNSHYWNLVKVDGNWYHWDTTDGWGGERFLLTDAELEAFEYYNASLNETLEYHWDRSAFPATP